MERYETKGLRSEVAVQRAISGANGRLLVRVLLGYVLVGGFLMVTSYRRLRHGALGGPDGDEVLPVFLRSTANARFWGRAPYAGLLAPLPARAPAALPTVHPSGDDATRTRVGQG